MSFTVSLVWYELRECYVLQAKCASPTYALRKRHVAREPLCVTPVLYNTEVLYIINIT